MKTRIKQLSIMLICLLTLAILPGCKKEIAALTSTLSPARNIEGTWKTPFAEKFYLSTNKCGGYARFAEQNQKLTWSIIAISDNQVIINNTTDYQGSFTIYNLCAQQPVPVSYLVSSMTGTISSSQMDLFIGNEKVGSMSFTSNNLTGYYDRKICDSYGCSGLSTNPGTLILTK